MMSIVRRIVAGTLAGAVAAGVAVTAATAPAAALTRDQLSAAPVQETGTVVRVLDGDTVRVRIGSEEPAVRLLGINAPEVVGVDEPQCGGPQAEELLASLLPEGTRVQLRSTSATAQGMKSRPQRYLFAYQDSTGDFTLDVQEQLARSGWVMWFTLDQEAALSQPYRLLIDEARAAGRGIWNPAACGTGPAPDAAISMYVNWDAVGNDGDNPNGEFVLVRNAGTSPLPLGGWHLRDSSHSWLTFPAGTTLAPGDYLRVRSGTGTSSGNTFYYGSDAYYGSESDLDRNAPMFPNPVKSNQFLGDGAYLFDTLWNLRSAYVYPCTGSCTEPLRGAVRISKAVFDPAGTDTAAKEYVDIRNVSDQLVSLEGYYLRRNLSTYPFEPGTVLLPGERVRVWVGRGTATTTEQYWGYTSTLLGKRDSVQVWSMMETLVTCKAWGGATC